MKNRGPHIEYLNLGPWPGFVGVTTDPKAFAREMRRMGIDQEVAFMGHERAHATVHSFISPRGEQCYIIALGDFKGRTKEQVAGLIAHEAMHIIQYMQDELARGGRLGVEAEAYLMQMLVQECLQRIWDSRFVRSREPSSAKRKGDKK